jgi:hypothetical protein
MCADVFAVGTTESEVFAYDTAQLSHEAWERVEADSYWCVSKLLDGIQDHYTFSLPGIQKMIFQLKEVIARTDGLLFAFAACTDMRIAVPLSQHFEEQQVQYMQFAFRWMNCLLIRELSLPLIIRMWDTYFAEGLQSVSSFHVFVCAALLHTFSKQLCAMEFQDALIFLQNLPTREWSTEQIELLVSQGFYLQSLFEDSNVV